MLLIAILYLPSLDLKLFADDFISWNTVLKTINQPWWYLLGINYNPEFYRPLEHLLIRGDVLLMGINPFDYRIAAILGHVLTALTVFWFARKAHFDHYVSLGATLIFGFNQANAMAALSNDAACQIYSTLFGTVALGLLIREQPDGPLKFRRAMFSALWLLGALMWKDAGISYLPAVAYLVLREGFLRPPDRRWRRVAVLAAPIIAVSVLYFAMRFHAGVTGPGIGKTGRYDLWFGLNVPANLSLFLLGMLTPIGSSIFVLRVDNVLFLAFWSVTFLATCTGVISGNILCAKDRPSDRPRLIMLAVLMLLVMLPDIFMNKVSELYIYKPNAMFVILFAAALDCLFRLAARRRRYRLMGLLIAFLIGLMVSHLFSINHKQERMRANGLLCDRLMNEIRLQMPRLASHKILVSNRVPGPAPLYSIYYMEGIHVLGGSKVFELYYGEKIQEYRYYPFEMLDHGLKEITGEKVVILYRRDHAYVATVDGTVNPFRNMPP